MTNGTHNPMAYRGSSPLAWIVPGPLRQLTGGYLYDARIVDGLRARHWQVGVTDVGSRRWPLDPAAGRRLMKAINRERWRAVVVDELAHPALAAALFRGRLCRALDGAPLILLVHHLRCSEPSKGLSRATAQLIERFVLRSADLVVCNSETTARTVRPLARRDTPVEVVRPGWDTHQVRAAHPYGEQGAPLKVAMHRVPASTSSGAARRIATAETADFRLLLVGHWTPRKGILDALAAVARLGPHVTLDLVGEQDRDPQYAARVRAALGDPILRGRVRVHGRVSADALAARYAAADALILPSTHEGYGMVLAEAVAAGLPIVATRVGAVPEVVRDGLEASLVPAGDVAALAGAIDRLATEPEQRKRGARFARERALALPRWSESIDAFEAHLRALLARTLADA